MGLFDFDGDGKMSLGEHWVAYKIFEECTKEDTNNYNYYLDGGDEDYSWRDCCEDGFEYGLDAEDYEIEEEYEAALKDVKKESCNEKNEMNITLPLTLQVSVEIPKRKERSVLQQGDYEWRRKYFHKEIYGLQINDFASEKEFQQAFIVAREQALNDKNIYYYCSVIFENNLNPYHYRTNDMDLKIGDMVVVPVGYQNEEVVAEIVSVEQHTRLTVPYPVDKCKYIIRKYDEKER